MSLIWTPSHHQSLIAIANEFGPKSKLGSSELEMLMEKVRSTCGPARTDGATRDKFGRLARQPILTTVNRDEAADRFFCARISKELSCYIKAKLEQSNCQGQEIEDEANGQPPDHYIIDLDPPQVRYVGPSQVGRRLSEVSLDYLQAMIGWREHRVQNPKSLLFKSADERVLELARAWYAYRTRSVKKAA